MRAAEKAGVGRIVHISITNPSPESPLPYFRGKAAVEEIIAASGLSYAIVRPTVVFGAEGILINNIAWLLRRFPVFAVPGPGDYRLQPVFVEDLAGLAVAAAQREENLTVDAAGPDVFTFDALVRLVAKKIGSRARVAHVPPWLALTASRAIGHAIRDVLLTQDELAGLTANLLVSNEPPTGSAHLADWLVRNADHVGQRYASEMEKHYR